MMNQVHQSHRDYTGERDPMVEVPLDVARRISSGNHGQEDLGLLDEIVDQHDMYRVTEDDLFLYEATYQYESVVFNDVEISFDPTINPERRTSITVFTDGFPFQDILDHHNPFENTPFDLPEYNSKGEWGVAKTDAVELGNRVPVGKVFACIAGWAWDVEENFFDFHLVETDDLARVTFVVAERNE